MTSIDNQVVSKIFRETADLLALQSDDPSRVQAYLRGADEIDHLEKELRTIWQEEGREGLTKVPFIGEKLAASIEQILTTGHCWTLERLRGHLDPEQLLRELPGVGETLAARIHNELHLETLQDVEAAANDGRLAKVRGIGPRRAQIIALYLRDSHGKPVATASHELERHQEEAMSPTVELLLAIDSGYRERVELETLPLIAPRRFNPQAKAWLPIWHDTRDNWSFTAMYSNTPRAHQLGKTRDWVVIFIENADIQKQYTVVTEYTGRLEGMRVVRGLEDQCLELYSRPLRVHCPVVPLPPANNNKLH